MSFRKKDNDRNIHKRKKRVQKLVITSGWLLCAAAFIIGGLIVVGISGRYNLKRQAISYAAGKENTPQAVMAMANDRKGRQADRIRYKEQEYSYNNDILTFLFMGIDKERRADALFLLVLNPHEEVINLIPINSNTMSPIAVYDEQGIHKNTITTQIGIQYMLGDSGKVSCEYQIKAVSNLLGGISVNGYLAVDMDMIPEVIELIDGMDLEAAESISDDDRLERQIYLLTEFISRVKLLTRKDITIPVKIYNKISGRVITDITADEVVYLAATAGGYQFDAGQVVMIPGKSIDKEEYMDRDYDEFYVDEEALYELILDIFYEPVS